MYYWRTLQQSLKAATHEPSFCLEAPDFLTPTRVWIVPDKFKTRSFSGTEIVHISIDPITTADKRLVRVWRIRTSCREQSLVRPIMDQNIYQVRRF